MQKLVVLKLDGDLVQGVQVTLEIGADNSRAAIATQGYLPPQPELVAIYSHWQSTYRSLADFRITPIRMQIGGDRAEQMQLCHRLAVQLNCQLNSWLNCESFRPLKEKLLKQLTPADLVRVLVKTNDILLRRLPWQLWNLWEEYAQAEVALSAQEYENPPVPNTATSKDQVRILAILGNSEGIAVERDRELLEQLPDAQTTFLVEPQRRQLNEQLWQQPWDILFFAGHSCSQNNGESGEIYINQHEKLTIDELKYALKQAVSSGLRLAIFNSCDGLGLARQLEELHIGQIIVMREPVPDRVAQEFLQSLLSKYAGGEPLYLAVRHARERLQGMATEYPGAIWLPVICQNPASIPPTWQDLRNQLNRAADGNIERPLINKYSRRAVFFASVVVTSVIIGVRQLGLIQPLELQAFDHLQQLRPQEGPDQRLLLVTITEDDFKLPQQQQRKGSLSDRALALLLQKLEPYQPRAIGLDIYRDFPVDAHEAHLANRLRRNNNFIAICKVSEPQLNEPGVAPPPEIPAERQGFSDFVQDSDGVLRRHLIAMKPGSTSPCTTPYALSAQLAFRYLEAEGITVQYTRSKDLQVGKVVFKRLRSRMGSYQKLDDWGYQILLNYRSYGSTLEVAEKVTLKDVLAGAVKPEAVKNRIVLIGITARSAGDYFPTPFSTSHTQEMPGVIVHAQMVSQILSAVLNQRTLLWVWPTWAEAVWVWGWSILGGILALWIQHPLRLGLTGVAALVVLYLLCFGLIIQGGWVPLVPAALTLVVTGSVVFLTILRAINSNISI